MFSLANLQTILFDLDGTIADTNEIIQRSMLETLERESGRAWTREDLLPHWGMRLRQQLHALYPVIDLECAVPYYRERYAFYEERLLAVCPGVVRMLEALQRGGYQLGVVTSKKRYNAHRTIDLLDFRRFFPVIVCEEDTAAHKPSPEPLWHALALCACAPERAIYVGDNPDDIHAARAAGMGSVAVSWGLRASDELRAAAPDAVIDTPAGLLALLSFSGVPAATNSFFVRHLT